MDNRPNNSIFDILPDDMLKYIYGYFNSINDKDSFLSSCSLFHRRLQSVKIAQTNTIHHNFKSFNCDISKINSEDCVLNFMICKNMIIAQGYYFIKAYDLYSLENKWVHKNYDCFKHSDIYSHDDKIIYTTKISNNLKPGLKLVVLDLLTGHIIFSLKLDKLNSNIEIIKVFENQIITKLNNSSIICRDLRGKILNQYDFDTHSTTETRHLLITKQFIVNITCESICIIDRVNGGIKYLAPGFYISTAMIHNKQLICGNTINTTSSDVNIFDLATATKVYEYNTHLQPIPGLPRYLGMAAKTNHVILTHETGKIILFDMIDRSHHVLETATPFTNSSVSIQEGYLLIKSNSHIYQSSLSIWNIKNKERLLKLYFDQIYHACISNNMLFISTENGFSKYNFNVSPKDNIIKVPTSQINELDQPEINTNNLTL